jgi:hypothetical protein
VFAVVAAGVVSSGARVAGGVIAGSRASTVIVTRLQLAVTTLVVTRLELAVTTLVVTRLQLAAVPDVARGIVVPDTAVVVAELRLAAASHQPRCVVSPVSVVLAAVVTELRIVAVPSAVVDPDIRGGRRVVAGREGRPGSERGSGDEGAGRRQHGDALHGLLLLVR